MIVPIVYRWNREEGRYAPPAELLPCAFSDVSPTCSGSGRITRA